MKTRFAISASPAAELTAAEVRVPHAPWLVAGAGIAVCAALLWVTRNYTFFYDEWTFITTNPGWTFATYFRPHNEHPSILFRAGYSLLLHTVGLRSYVPYVGLLVTIHLINVALLFVVVRRRAGDLIALGAAALLLLPGGGWENVIWAFQLAWLASVGLGLAMLIVIQEPSRPRAMTVAAGLLATSLAFSGIGVVFGIAATVYLLLTPTRRRDLGWLAPVAGALLVWYLLIGHLGNHPDPQPTPANVFLIPAYVLWGLSQSLAGLGGQGGWVAIVALLGALFAIAWTWWRRGADAFGISVAVALVGFYVVTGLTRAQLGFIQAGSSRYAYVAEVLWLIVLADAARHLPWRSAWRPAIVALLFVIWVGSGAQMLTNATARERVMNRQVADYYALAAERSDPCLDPKGAVDPEIMPAETDPAAYYRSIDRYGDPRGGMPLVDPVSYEAGVHRLRKASC